MNQEHETLPMKGTVEYCHGILPTYGIIAGRYAGNYETEWLPTDLIQIHHAQVDLAFRPTTPSHAHRESIELFIILEGTITFQVGGDKITLGPNTFLCISPGVLHQTLEVSPQSRFLTIRAPSLEDKAYKGGSL